MKDEANAMAVCYRCIDDKFLRDEVRKEGERDTCSFCGQARKCFSIDRLAERIQGVIEEQFHVTPSQPEGIELLLAKDGLWERSGEPVESVIAEVAGVNERIADAVRKNLSDQMDVESARMGEEDPYGTDALYEENDVDSLAFEQTWDGFVTEITKRSRFFSKRAQRALDEIFHHLDQLKTFDGKPALRTIRHTDTKRYLYRARISPSEKTLKEILTKPVMRLGPPPFRKAVAGRMNASGISVFYGALDQKTCIAEARAPVGSHVVVGRFEVVRPILLLDLDALTRVYVDSSHFDPEYGARWRHAVFLRRLGEKISRPVMPGDETFEYLATQAVSEYLAEHHEPPLDGIIFHSSQTGNKGRNIVLFNHACRVEPYDLPNDAEIEVGMGWATNDDADNTIYISETVPLRRKEKSKKLPESIDIDAMNHDPEDIHDHRAITLQLNIEHVEVFSVTGVSFHTSPRAVYRRRETAEKKSHKF